MAPPILMRAGELLARYDVLFCDVWGVVHDGLKAFPMACDALARFRAGGGTVILVSNAPVPQERVAAMLDAREVPRDRTAQTAHADDQERRHQPRWILDSELCATGVSTISEMLTCAGRVATQTMASATSAATSG